MKLEPSRVLQTGQPLKLSCKVQGSPEIRITWLKDGSEIVSSDRNIMSFDGSVAALEIPSCCVEDSGEFVCLAINESGRDQCSSSVAIKGLYCFPSALLSVFSLTFKVHFWPKHSWYL